MFLLNLGRCLLFLFTCSVAEFLWTQLIQVVAHQYGQTPTDEQVNAMDWTTKKSYLKSNLFTVSRQINYIFKQWGKVILSGMHPNGPILNFDDWRVFQKRGIKHMHTLIHILDAPKIDKNEDSE